MPQPSQGQVHVNRPLTNISVAFMQNPNNFVWNKVFPIIPVDKKSDVYFTYPLSQWFADDAQVRRAGTESAGSGYPMSTDSYTCQKYSFHKDIDEDTRDNADMPIDLDRDATEFVTQTLMQRLENQWVTNFFTTSVWGTDVTPSTLWSDYTGSDPLTDIDAGKEAILKNTGFEANTFVIGYAVYRQLMRHPDFRDQIKYTSPDNINAELLAKILDVPRVIVAKSVKRTSIEGETNAFDFIHGKHALLCHVAPNPGILIPSAGYSFAWKGISRGAGTNIAVKKFYIPRLEVDRVEGSVAFANKVVSSSLGYFFNGAVA
jgi:hypothetical protein